MNQAKVKYPFYYRVTDNDGTPHLETVFQQEALDFVSKAFQETETILNVERIERGK